MRIWFLHPRYLDAKGIVALWRETLLAKQVLLNKTKSYKNHPQLDRFKKLNIRLMQLTSTWMKFLKKQHPVVTTLIPIKSQKLSENKIESKQRANGV